jgi:hypothetical protein
MRLTFTTANSATMVYTFNGVSVTKGIVRYQFSTPTTCVASSSDRASSTNYQDLWWNPSESGWGVNLAHQGSIIFATLYTYDSGGNPMWLAMSAGQQVGTTRTYQGPLHRYSGPPFNASPWSPAVTGDAGRHDDPRLHRRRDGNAHVFGERHAGREADHALRVFRSQAAVQPLR